MTTDELPDDGVTKANFLSGRKRTKQYYATRTGTVWTFHTIKTREPLDVMKAAWGHELDIITMLAMLPPQPIKRDWYRFKGSMEVVDLGRNLKQAQLHFAELEAEARGFRDTTRAAEQSRVEKVRAAFDVDGQRKRWRAFAERIGGNVDPFKKLEKVNWALEMCSTVVIVPTFEEDESGKKLYKALVAAEASLRQQQEQHQISPSGFSHWSPPQIAISILKQNTYKPALDLLRTNRDTLTAVFTARENLARRTAEPETVKVQVVTKVEEVPPESMAGDQGS